MNMEKSIKGLLEIADWHYGKYEQTNEEDYLNDGDFLTAVANMLKAQEPVEPIRKVIGCGWRYFCGKCGNSIVAGQNFCQKCGQAVKWK